MKHNVFQLFRSYLQAGKEQLKNLKGNPFKKKWLKRLDRYIIVKFLGTYFFAIALIISIAVVFDINENIDDFINNKAPISAIIFDYYLNFIPYYTGTYLARRRVGTPGAQGGRTYGHSRRPLSGGHHPFAQVWRVASAAPSRSLVRRHPHSCRQLGARHRRMHPRGMPPETRLVA